jgi:nucleolar pre-ribosomal-associated protein 2
MQGQLRLWMECGSTQSSSSGVYRTLLDNIYCTGIEVMFSLEILRQHQDSKSDNPLFEALVKNIGISPPQVASVLPRIFNSFFQCIKTFRGALFSQSSGQSSGGSEEVRSAGMDFFASCCLILDHIDDIDQIWKTRVALLSVVDAENLYNPRRVDMDQLLRQNGELATETLSSAWKGIHILVRR